MQPSQMPAIGSDSHGDAKGSDTMVQEVAFEATLQTMPKPLASAF